MEQVNRTIIFTVINDLSYDQRMHRICHTLSSAGYKCLLIGRKLKKSKPLQTQSYFQKRLNCLFTKGPAFYLEYNLRLLFFMLFNHSDAICSVDADTAMAGLVVTRLKRNRFVFDAHEWFSEVPEVKDRRVVKSVWKWVEGKAFKNAELCYTVGEELAKQFTQIYQRAVMVIMNAPIPESVVETSPDPDKYILYQGALNRGRGLENLIEAMEQLDCRLLIAGEGDLSGQLRKSVNDRNLEDKVQFLGMISPENLKSYTQKAWLGYNVSEPDGLSYYYSMNNKFFDYIHAGLPSLINDFPEYRRLNNQYRVGLITANNIASIVENARILLEDEKLRYELSKNSLLATEQLNWNIESVKLIQAYNNLFEK